MGRRETVRWWPAALIVVAAVVLLARIWSGETTRQMQVMNTGAVVLVGLLLLVLWFVLLSRLPWSRRRLGLVAFLVLGAVGVAVFRIEGVTGDLVPIVGWRWGAESSSGEATGAASPAADAATALFPQFLGPDRNGILAGPALAGDWSAAPPAEIWRRPIGPGWSSFAVVGRLAVTQEQDGDDELVTAYDVATGELLWAHADRARYETTIAGVGPRATPTVANGRVFSVGATGIVNALDLVTGDSLWRHELEAELGARTPEWGRSSSPLVVDGRVIVSAGGVDQALVAYDAASGALLWKGGSGFASYSSPVVIELAGVRQIVIFLNSSVAGLAIESGEQLWSFPWPADQPNVAQPLPLGGDRLLVSSGYGIGAKMLRIRPGAGDRLQAELLWESPRLKAKFASPVRFGEHVYGLDDGVMICLDPTTGERCWKRGRYGHGQLLLVGDRLVVLAENGEVVLIDPNPEELTELGRFRAIAGKVWNPPALADSTLLVRNHEEAVAFELPVAVASVRP